MGEQERVGPQRIAPCVSKVFGEGLWAMASVEAQRSSLPAGGGFPERRHAFWAPGGLEAKPSPPSPPAPLNSGPEARDLQPSLAARRGGGKGRGRVPRPGHRPRPPARKEAATAQSGDPGPCPYMGSRKRLARLPYVIISKFSLALPVAGRLCSLVGAGGRGRDQPALKGPLPRMNGALRTILHLVLEGLEQ